MSIALGNNFKLDTSFIPRRDDELFGKKHILATSCRHVTFKTYILYQLWICTINYVFFASRIKYRETRIEDLNSLKTEKDAQSSGGIVSVV